MPEQQLRNLFADKSIPKPTADRPAPVQPKPVPQVQPKAPAQTEAPKQEANQYSLAEALGDALSHRLGFGTPFKNVQNQRMNEANMKMNQASHQQNTEMHAAEMHRVNQDNILRGVTQKIAPYMLAIAKEDSRYYQDLPHLAEAINSSERAQKFFGGWQEYKDTGQVDEETGMKIFDMSIYDKPGGKLLEHHLDTAPGAVDRFGAVLDPETRLKTINAMSEIGMRMEKTKQLAVKYMNESASVKEAMGLPSSAIDQFKEFKERAPAGLRDLKDWQIMEIVGSPIPKEYKMIDSTYRQMGEDGVGVVVEHRQTGEKKLQLVDGLSWNQINTQEYKDREIKTAEHVKLLDNFTEPSVKAFIDDGGTKRNLLVKREEFKWDEGFWPKDENETSTMAKGRAAFKRKLATVKNPRLQEVMVERVLPYFQTSLDQISEEFDESTGIAKSITATQVTSVLDEIMDMVFDGPKKDAGNEEEANTSTGNSWQAYDDGPPPEPWRKGGRLQKDATKWQVAMPKDRKGTYRVIINDKAQRMTMSEFSYWMRSLRDSPHPAAKKKLAAVYKFAGVKVKAKPSKKLATNEQKQPLSLKAALDGVSSTNATVQRFKIK